MSKIKLKALRELGDSSSPVSIIQEEPTPKKSKKKGVGRPKKLQKFDQRVTFLLTEKQMEILDKKRCKGSEREMEIGKFVRMCLEQSGLFETGMGRPHNDPFENIPRRNETKE